MTFVKVAEEKALQEAGETVYHNPKGGMKTVISGLTARLGFRFRF
jgi:hypothetical protein